jgi:hypothetical protein
MDARESHLKTPHLLQFRKVVNEGGMLVKSESNEVRLLSNDAVII